MVSLHPELTTNCWELASEKADISWANSWRKFFAISLIPTFFLVEIFNICHFRKAAVRKSAFLNQSGAICCVSVCSGSLLPGWRKGFLSGPLSVCICTSILACLSETCQRSSASGLQGQQKHIKTAGKSRIKTGNINVFSPWWGHHLPLIEF